MKSCEFTVEMNSCTTRCLTVDVDEALRLWTLLSKSVSIRSEYMSLLGDSVD